MRSSSRTLSRRSVTSSRRALSARARVGLAAAGSVCALLAAVPAAAAAPFACATPAAYVSLGESSSTTLNQVTTQPDGSATFAPVGAPAPIAYNAIAFNPTDDFIYGVSGADNAFVRIDGSGTVTSTGVTAPPGFINQGAFDDSGNFYVRAGSASAPLYRVDPTSFAATPVALSADVEVADFTFLAGYLWGVNARGAASVVARIDPATGRVDTFPAAVVPGGNIVGAAWTYGNGNLGFSVNAGGVFQVRVGNPGGAAPTFTLISSSGGEASGNNDGTSCQGTSADLSMTKAGPASVGVNDEFTWTLRVADNGPGASSGYVVTDVVPAGVTVVAAGPGCAISGNRVTCVGSGLRPGEVRTITVTAVAPPFATTLVNSASVLGNEADPLPANDSATATTTVVAPIAPDTTITSGPGDGATIAETTPTFGFAADVPGSTFACRVDSGLLTSCSTPTQIGPLAPGPHTFSVAATSPDGITDPTPAARSFTIAEPPPLNRPPGWLAPTPADGAHFEVVSSSPLTFGLSASDPDALDTVHIGQLGLPAGASVTGGDGNPASATFSWTPTAAQAGDYVVTVTASDSASPSASAPSRTFTIHVTALNVAPTVSSAAADAHGSEGQTLTTSGAFTDADGDPLALSADSTAGTFVGHPDGTWQWSLPTNDDVAQQTITVTASDGHGHVASDAFTYSAANVAPVVRLALDNPRTVDEGPAQVTYRYTFTDAGSADTIVAATTSCGGATKVAGSDTRDAVGGSFRCVFPDGLKTLSVRVQVTDDDGGVGSDSIVVLVRNVAPTATLAAGNDLTVDEGPAQHTYTYSVSDPGDDTITATTTSCGSAGTKVAGSDTPTSFACVFPDGPAASTVSVSATDSDGDTGAADTQAVTVHNVAPTVTLAEDNVRSVDEGPAAYTYAFSVTDPGQDTVQSIDASCGDGGELVAGSVTASSVRCTFPDGPASPTVSVRATDSDGDTGPADTQTVTVHNVAPTATFDAGNAVVVAAGPAGHAFTFTVVDPGRDTQSIDASCGTGTRVPAADTPTSFTCAFTTSGYTTLTVRATDSDGDSGPTDSLRILVYAFPGDGTVSFVIGDGAASVDNDVTFWGAQWAGENPLLSGAGAPNAFKGFAERFAGATPGCGRAWTTGPGNTKPPSTLPAYMGTVVASTVTKSGSAIGGDVARIAVVRPDPGYGPDPGHAGTGRIVAVVTC